MPRPPSFRKSAKLPRDTCQAGRTPKTNTVASDVAAQKATTAADAFAALAKDSATSGSVPRGSDPSAAPLLDAVFDVGILRSKASLGEPDIGSLSDWSAAGNKVGIVYILAGTGITDVSQAGNDAKVAAQANRNSAQFASELGRYMDAELALQSTIAGIVATDAGRSGVDEVRSGVTATITGVITTFPVDGIDTAWRQARVAALEGAAPGAAKLLLPAQCTSIRATADQVGQQLNDPIATQGLKTFASLLKC